MTDPPDWDLRSAELARAAIAEERPTAWFDELYAAGTRREIGMPWDRGAPLPLVVDYFAAHPLEPGTRAIVIGCGLGIDAEYLSGLVAENGSSVTAFDISETAIEFVRARYPSSTVDYRVANLLELPAEWIGAFDLVLEVINVQALPLALRPRAVRPLRPCSRRSVVWSPLRTCEPMMRSYRTGHRGPSPGTRSPPSAPTGWQQ